MTTIYCPDYSTNTKYGKKPEDRSIEELLASGFILLDKTFGPTSHQVAAWARDMLQLDKLGHGGTLDPFATGLITLLSGKAVRLSSKVLSHDKSYIAVLKIHGEHDADDIRAVMAKLTGKIYNVPPEISAVKVQVRTRTIHRFDLIEMVDNHVIAHIECESGTYVRTLASDMGLMLDCAVDLKELRRPTSGPFSLKSAVTMQQLADAYWLWTNKGDDSAMLRIVHPIESLLEGFPRLVIKDSAAAALTYGAPLMRPGLISLESNAQMGERVLIVSVKGEVVALANLLVEPSTIATMVTGEVAKPDLVLMDEGTYPKGWVN